ncbi:hypothetical protein CEXT_58331 [Caerostris extrusa]|uniref:Uncharacterized protein n=1 Tax=Caerostris extrusa TaxID=172846 RepID=A0AAV4RYR8_CAEEX|nr:hypothetical protein CEXT_58331 [Caerostris extrusa]
MERPTHVEGGPSPRDRKALSTTPPLPVSCRQVKVSRMRKGVHRCIQCTRVSGFVAREPCVIVRPPLHPQTKYRRRERKKKKEEKNRTMLIGEIPISSSIRSGLEALMNALFAEKPIVQGHRSQRIVSCQPK